MYFMHNLQWLLQNKVFIVKTVSKKGDRAVSRDLARDRRSEGTVARTVAHSSKLKIKLQIGAPGKKHRNLAKNARISLLLF